MALSGPRGTAWGNRMNGIRQRIRQFDARLEQVERFAVVLLYAILIAALAVHVFARNILHTGSASMLEASPSLMLWLALAGATLGLKHRRHITIGLLRRLLPPVWGQAADRLTGLFAMLLSAVLFYAAILFVGNEIELFGVQGWPSVCFPIFFGIAFFRSALRMMGMQQHANGPPP